MTEAEAPPIPVSLKCVATEAKGELWTLHISQSTLALHNAAGQKICEIHQAEFEKRVLLPGFVNGKYLIIDIGGRTIGFLISDADLKRLQNFHNKMVSQLGGGEVEQRMRKALRKSVIAAVVAVAGLIVSIASVMHANKTGDSFTVLWGAVLFGAIWSIVNFREYLKLKKLMAAKR